MTRRRKGASDSCFYYKWLDKALCDLQAARLLLTYGGDYYNIAFHCQQAIEKALKGYLLFRTGRHFDGHNLTYLCRQAIQLDSKAFSEYLDESAALNDLYIETRYPTDLPFEIDELEVRRYLDMAERMFAAIRQQLYEGGRPHEIVQRR
ncbi:MAG: HEPN domain-containing protein [Agathobaculum butyriciproducens]|nr:HEPN domain-containing protein [Agathobaculum butyriciproducens]